VSPFLRGIPLALFGAVLWAGPAVATELVDRLPELELSDLQGTKVDVSSLPDGDVILLDFWATWCAPCRKAMPVYAKLEAAYEEHGFRVVTINQDRRRDHRKIDRAMKQMDVDFPVILDPDEELGKLLGVLTLPTAFLVAGDGQIHSGHVGYLPGDEKALESEIRLLLGLDESR